MQHQALIAIDVGGTKSLVACADIATGEVHSMRLPTHLPGENGRQTLERLCSAARELTPSGREIAAAAAVFPGVVRDGELTLSPNTPALNGLALAPLIRESLTPGGSELPVLLDNDVKAGALAESQYGALAGTRHALYLNLGTGLSAASIVDGRVMQGDRGAAMEIGYMLSPFLTPDALLDGSRQLPGVAPLESIFSGGALDAWAREVCGEQACAQDLFVSQDPGISEALDRRILAWAAQVTNLAVALDVKQIAMAGGMTRHFERLAQVLNTVLTRFVPFPPAVVMARFADDAPLRGALVMASTSAGLTGATLEDLNRQLDRVGVRQ
ncbi:ROK family protein [Salinicola aestuarinus]|uniref:ROK family protein n=1 Tax=Salinicola aestuarinus TaxID=1949082 RepID=UPI000DA1D8B0|nr:ROK family protein [Salinicola aestuarinus]